VIRIDILTLFPEMFHGVLSSSILGRAATGGFASYHLHDIRDHAPDRHRTVDDRPFGGGPGMVMTCQPLYDAVLAAERMDGGRPARRILLTPQGEPLGQARVEDLAHEPRLLLIAGHFEGIDERVVEELSPLEISVGDFVLSGGEVAALVLIDAVVRLVPGVLGHEDSARDDSFVEREIREGGTRARLLEGPQYTRPRTWRDRTVPEVLLSGDHGAVEKWRRRQMMDRTRERRPDLLDKEQRASGPGPER
jgi:tRNA (guanine37-N1)-methyltransferase